MYESPLSGKESKAKKLGGVAAVRFSLSGNEGHIS